MKKLLAVTVVALTLTLSLPVFAETPASRYQEIAVLWSTGTWQSFTASDGTKSMSFYMLGDCLLIKDVSNNRVWLFSEGMWQYIDAKDSI